MATILRMGTRLETKLDGGSRIAMLSIRGLLSAVQGASEADLDGQCAYVLQLARTLARLGHDVDIWTRPLSNQSALEWVMPGVRILRVPCWGQTSRSLRRTALEWSQHVLSVIEDQRLVYDVLSSHFWDAGLAAHHLCAALHIPHVHTPHSLALAMCTGLDGRDAKPAWHGAALCAPADFSERVEGERIASNGARLVIAMSPEQRLLLLSAYGVPAARLSSCHPLNATWREACLVDHLAP